MHAIHARLPKNFVLEERIERYASAIELDPANWRGRWAEACWPSIGSEARDSAQGGTLEADVSEAPKGSEGRASDGGFPTEKGASGMRASHGNEQGTDDTSVEAAPETRPERFSEVRLDLGCGKGAFAIESARREPDVLFVAMDSEPVCVAYAAQHVCESGLSNVVVVPGNGMRVREFFSPGELSRIYLNFPTPFPRKRDAHRRMASMERLLDFREVLAEGAEVCLRTDSQPLFDFVLTQVPLAGYELLWQSRDARADFPDEPSSEYEERLSAQGARVCALAATPGPAPESPVQTAELSLAAYLPQDLEGLEGISYAPHGMQATVQNLRNHALKAQAAAGRR